MLRSILFISAISLLLVACGNKGPLVLPDKTQQEQQNKDKKKDQPADAQPSNKNSAGGAANQR